MTRSKVYDGEKVGQAQIDRRFEEVETRILREIEIRFDDHEKEHDRSEGDKTDPTILAKELVKTEIGHLRELVMGRIDSLEKGQEKAAEALATAVDRTEVRVNEKLFSLKEAVDLTINALGEQLHAVDQKLTQVDRDRTLYVTRNDLDTVTRAFTGELTPLQNQRSLQAGIGVGKNEIQQNQESTRRLIMTLMGLLLTLGLGVGGLVLGTRPKASKTTSTPTPSTIVSCATPGLVKGQMCISVSP